MHLATGIDGELVAPFEMKEIGPPKGLGLWV